MSYHANISVDFRLPPARVYKALADIGNYHQWTKDVSGVSHPGPMHPGLRYTIETQVLGRTNRTQIEVIKMIPDNLIIIQTHTGLVDFTAEYHLQETGTGCRLMLNAKLDYSHLVFNLARPVAQAVAESRLRGDLERMRAYIERA